MGFLLSKIVGLALKPPAINVLLGLLGLALRNRARRLATALLAISIFGLWALSTPLIAAALALGIERFEPLDIDGAGARAAGAIVVLGGGRDTDAPEYGGDTVSGATLLRLRYGAFLHRRTRLPVLVTGGSVFGERRSEADLMAGVLTAEFRVPVRWREDRARNTAENARESSRLLLADGITRVILVTEATHMLRSVEMFSRAGLGVVPAPTAFRGPPPHERGAFPGPRDLIPTARALVLSSAVLHEQMGRLWYRLRY